MDPVPTFPLPHPPPVDLGELIRRTNGASHAMMPLVEGFYSALDGRTSAAEAALKKAAQPVLKTLARRTNGAQQKLATAVAPVAGMLQERTSAAQVALQQYPVPTAGAEVVYWTLIDVTDCSARVVPLPRGQTPDAAEPVRAYGPYATDAQAQQATATYRTYLTAQGLCDPTRGGGGGSAPPALDYYWVE